MDKSKEKNVIYFPVYLEISNRKVLVVGGGAVAQRKIESLLEAGAVIIVASKDLTPKIEQYGEEGKIMIIGREYEDGFLENVFMVIAATDDADLNHRISQDALKKGLLINAVDQPSDCNFIFPSIIRRGDLILAISTSGKSPALARKIRTELEHEFGKEYEILLNIMGELRKKILSLRLPQEKNSLLFKQLIEGPMPEAIRDGNWGLATEIINTILNKDYSLDQVKKMGEGN